MKQTAITWRLALVLIAAGVLISASLPVQAGSKKEASGAGGGFIGVMMQQLDDDIIKGLDLNTRDGILIADVADDSPADEAGIEEGDVLIEFDGMKVDSPEALKRMVLKTRVGDKVKVKLIRDGRAKVVSLIVGEQPETAEYEVQIEKPGGKSFSFSMPHNLKKIHRNVLCYFDPSRRLGVQVKELDGDLASYFGVDVGQGVLVLGVEDDSAAEEAEIHEGDVILEIDGEAVHSVGELKAEIKDLEADEPFDVVVMRHGMKKTLEAVFKDDDEDDDEDEDIRTFTWKSMKHGEPPVKIDVEKFKFDENEMEQLRQEMKQLKLEMKKLRHDLQKELNKLHEE